jgi:hypothetical protein
MSNCNKLFRDFNNEITPTSKEMSKMKTSRVALEDKIRIKIWDKLGVYIDFYSQGSSVYRMKTLIIKEDGTYDADRGIFLPIKPDENPQTVQGWVLDAVNGHTHDGASHRNKCIRVYYKAAYNIDFPLYYEIPADGISYLATKGGVWVRDDPAEMIDWFLKFKDEDGQLIRVIKYLKAWASKCAFKMPSGIALSVWAARNFAAVADRDDECLLALLKAIRNTVYYGVSCISPVAPYDDFTAKMSESQKDTFRSELDDFCSDGQKAIDEKNQLKASKIWRKYLGNRFALGADEDVDARAAELMASASTILSGARLDIDGKINSTFGVPHQPHRNYGSKRGNRYLPVKNTNPQKIALLEEKELNDHFNFLKTRAANGVLNVYGSFQPTTLSPVYHYRITYSRNRYPEVRILRPTVAYNDDIHLYSDRSLCLFYPKDFSWHKRSKLFNTILPWTHEWFVFYELYQITGKWQHPFVDHKRIQN